MRRHGFIAGFLGLHRLVASAFLSVLLPAGPLGVGLVGKACAGEPAETPPVESIQPRSTTPNSATSVASICDALATA